MIAISVAQSLLAAFTIGLAVARLRVLLFVAPVERKAFQARLGTALGEGGVAGGLAVAAACTPGWIAELARRTLEVARDDGSEAGLGELAEAGLELSDAASKGIRALRILASMATAGGLLAAILHLQTMMAPDRGLRSLARGLVERTALEGGMLAMAIGVATAIVALAAQRVLLRAAKALIEDLKALTTQLEQHLGTELRN